MRQGTGPAATCVRPQRKKKERSTMKDSKSGSLPSGAGSLIPGFEVPQSPVFTVDWRGRKAGSRSGDAERFLETGEKYYFGEGAEQDYAEAVKWFLKAAEFGTDALRDGMRS